MLLRCWVIYISIAIVRHFLYLLYLCPLLDLQSATKIVRLTPLAPLFNVGCKFAWYLCACLTLFSHEYRLACSLAYFLEYVLWSISSTLGWRMWIIFKYQKFSFRVLLSIYVFFCKFWPGVAYKSVAYKKNPISRELQCNVILHCITSYTLEHFYLQCSSMFSLVCYCFYLLFTIFFSDAAGQEHSYLDEIPVEP